MDNDWNDIVNGTRRGDREASRLFYDRLAPMAMSVCLRYAQSSDEAAELLQDGFVKVFERIGQLREPERVAGWVRNIMENTCITQLRRTARWRKVVDGIPADEVPSPRLDPFTVAEVVAAIQQLPDALRLVFNLCEVEGYSQAEAAERLGLAASTVRVSLSRARLRLRELLSEYEPQ